MIAKYFPRSPCARAAPGAAFNGHLKAVQFCLEHGAAVDNTEICAKAAGGEALHHYYTDTWYCLSAYLNKPNSSST